MLSFNDDKIISEPYLSTFRAFSPLELKVIISLSFSVIFAFVSVDYRLLQL